MPQPSSDSVQAEVQYTPRRLIIECAWCNAEAGVPNASNASHSICRQHLRDMRRIVHERRERAEKLRQLLG